MSSRYHALAFQVKNKYPRFNVKERNKSWLMPIFWVLSRLTGQSYDNFTTTIFSTMYVSSSWSEKSDERKYRTLRHEEVHIEQFHCFPLGRWAWPINHLLMSLCYLLLLPAIFSMRAKFEREGYTQTLLVEFELGGPFSEDRMEYNARWLAETFGGSAYAWMWTRKKAYAWSMDTMRKINAGDILSPYLDVE